jgi:hypothetical protein
MSFAIFAAARTPSTPVIQAGTISQTSIQVTLVTASIEPATGIHFYRLLRSRNGAPFTQIAQLSPSQFPYLDTGLTSGIVYSYQAIGVNNAANADSSAPSIVSSASTNSAPPVSPPTPVFSSSSIKFNPGHYMQPRSLDNSGPGSQNFADIGLLSTTNAQLAAASLPQMQGINFVYSWAYVETAQGVYNFSKTIDADVVKALQTVPGCHIGICFRSFGNQGNGAITQSGTSGTTTFNAANTDLVPAYICLSTHNGNAGWLQSTDGYCYTKSAPKAPNPTEYLWSMSNQSGEGYSYLVGGNWWHPVAAQCFANMKQALACHIVPDGQGFTYDKHPQIEIILSWDEETANFGWGGTWSNRPPDDPGVHVNASGAFTGGTLFASADGTSVASCTALQLNAAIEQHLIGSKNAPARVFTASDPGASPTTWTVNAGFAHTSVGSCLSFLCGCNPVGTGNGFVTIAQLRQHMKNLAAGGIEFGNADLLGNEYSQDSSNVPWNYGNVSVSVSGNLVAATSGNLSSGSWTQESDQHWTILNGVGRSINYTQGSAAISWAGALTLSGPITGTVYLVHCHESNGLFVGGVYTDEAYENPGAYIPPLGGVVASTPATAHTSAVVGEFFAPINQKNGYIEGMDYGDEMGAGTAAYTLASTLRIFAAGQFDKTCRFFWQNCSNRYLPFPNEWNGSGAYILPAIEAMPAFNAGQTLLALPYLTGVAITSVTVVSSSSLTVHWAALSGVGTGMTVTVYRNGSVIATGQAGNSFTDTGLTTHTSYTYTLAMANANGTGPTGTGVSGTTS